MPSNVSMSQCYVQSSTPNRLYLGQRIYASGNNAGSADNVYIEVREQGNFTGDAAQDVDTETRSRANTVGALGWGDYAFDGTAAGRSVGCNFIAHIYSTTQPRNPVAGSRTIQRSLQVIGTTP